MTSQRCLLQYLLASTYLDNEELERVRVRIETTRDRLPLPEADQPRRRCNWPRHRLALEPGAHQSSCMLAA